MPCTSGRQQAHYSLHDTQDMHHIQSNTFFWITQNVMGACMCIMFLSIIKLNSIRVASILLVVAFAYDIFFVFITPSSSRASQS
jgi:hypothetical protein